MKIIEELLVFFSRLSGKYSLALLLASLPFFCIYPQTRFSNYTSYDGISGNICTDLLQDAQGFIWIGTFSGLNRFDGFEFKSFRANDSIPNSLSYDVIRCLVEDNQGLIWVGTYKGLNVFDPATEKFESFFHIPDSANSPSHNKVVSMAKSLDGKIWCATTGGGLYSVDPSNQSFEQHWLSKLPGLSPASDILEQIIPLSDGTLLLSTLADGILHYNPTSKNYRAFLPDSLLLKSPISFTRINETDFLVGNNELGLLIFELSTGSFTPLSQILGYHPDIKTNEAFRFMADTDSNIWICGYGHGLYKLNIRQKKLQTIKHNRDIPSSLISNRVISGLELHNGVKIFGTADGLSVLDIYANNIRSYTSLNLPDMIKSEEVYGLEVLNDSICLIAFLNEGVYSYNYISNSFSNRHQVLRNPAVRDTYIQAIHKKHSGTVFLGTNQGLARIELRTNQITLYTPEYNIPTHVDRKRVLSIKSTDNNTLWLATGAGLQKFDLDTEKFTLIPRPEGTSIARSDSFAWNLEFDHTDTLWVCYGYGGLGVFDTKTEEFARFYINQPQVQNQIASNNVKDILFDQNNNPYIATYKGLNHLNRQTNSFNHLGKKDGLSNEVILALEIDQNRDIWFSNQKNIIWMDPNSWKFREYGTDDGVLRKSYTNNSAIRLETGHLLFGNLGGINIFHPDSLITEETPPPLALTALEINNYARTQKKKNPGQIIGRPINRISSIDLKHNQNFLKFKYASLNYSLPKHIRYQYKLEGIDEDWVENGNERIATYTYLPHGRYEFMVRALYTNGLVAESKLLNIRIHPPFYKSLGAKFFYLLTLILLPAMVIWQRGRRLHIQKRHLESVVIERTEDLMSANAALEERQEEIISQAEEILKQKNILEEKQNQILAQRDEIDEKNKKLELHKAKLEEKVLERTRKLQAALEKAELSEKLKTAFLANMTHEIRTPMNSIIGFSVLLDDPELNEETRNNYIDIIKANSQELLFLIDDMLDLSQIESGDLKIRKETFSLTDLLLELSKIYQLKAEEKGLELRRSFDLDDQANIFSDKGRIRQVIRNLLENAIKFTEKGYIDISLSRIDKAHPRAEFSERNPIYYLISVTDTGIGIPKNQSESIFNRFHKVESYKDKLYRGAGLGLSISRKLIHLLEGQIWVDSKENEYSQFFFSLPVGIIEGKAVEDKNLAEEEHPLEFNGEGLKFLIAEDEWTNFEVISSTLRKSGAQITWAKNGQEALSFLQDGMTFDMGIIDIKMPVLDGFEFLKQAKEKFQDTLPPMLACTAFTLSLNPEDFYTKGFTDFLFKPFNPDELLKKITQNI